MAETNTTPAPEYVDERELTRRIVGIAPGTWQKWRERGEGPPFSRVGRRRILYRWSDVEAWIESRRVGGR